MLLQIWDIDVDMEQVKLILNLSIITVITSRVSPDMFPFLLPESTNATVAFQVETLIDYLETLKKKIWFLNLQKPYIRLNTMLLPPV